MYLKFFELFMLGKGHGSLYKASTKEESERVRGEGDKIEFIGHRFERGQVVGFGIGRRQDLPEAAQFLDE